VLKLLKVDGIFDDVMAVEQMRFRPKPDVFGFMRLLKKHKVKVSQCMMVEDSLENLRAAKRLGMRTVWVNAENRSASCVDVKIRNVMQLPRVLSRLS